MQRKPAQLVLHDAAAPGVSERSIGSGAVFAQDGGLPRGSGRGWHNPCAAHKTRGYRQNASGCRGERIGEATPASSLPIRVTSFFAPFCCCGGGVMYLFKLRLMGCIRGQRKPAHTMIRGSLGRNKREMGGGGASSFFIKLVLLQRSFIVYGGGASCEHLTFYFQSCCECFSHSCVRV